VANGLPIQHGAGEIAIRSRVLPMGVPLPSRSTLEIIRFAAANHLCVDLRYDGSVRRIEPYSLRQTAEGYFVLHAIRSGFRGTPFLSCGPNAGGDRNFASVHAALRC